MNKERFVTFYLSAMLVNATGKRVRRLEYFGTELKKTAQITVVLDNGERLRVMCVDEDTLMDIALAVMVCVMARLSDEEGT